MLDVMAEHLDSNRSVILQGDLNHRPDGPEYPRWVAAGLVDTFAAEGTGQPMTMGSNEPRSRIDYVWASGPLADRLVECRVVYEGAFRTNPDDPRSFALSDHLPVMATFAAQ
jgi:endonuclease/exonuclease/phosphatase (EEP) superfamily protein YafD